MKSRIIVLMAIAIAAISVVITGSRINFSTPLPAPAHALLRPNLSSYLGMDEGGTSPSWDPVADFAQAAARQPNLVGYFSGWAEPFATDFASTLHSHGIIPFVEMDPTDASIGAIAAGDYDDYLRDYADAVRDFRHPVVIAFGHEMNAPWYSWGYGHVAPATFVAAWKHIVTLFRHEGAGNVTWLWTVQADQPGTGPIASWWPGPQYVSWVGVDGFYYQPSNSFAGIFRRTIDQIRSITRLPVLLSETAVGPRAGQFAKIQDLFRGMAAYQTLGLVWFDVAQHGGIYQQDWQIENSPAAEYSFRIGVRDDLGGPGSSPSSSPSTSSSPGA
jgi:mannan endo-1,4-beta-mannosidase